MSLFDFFKPKKNETNEMFERMDASIFPKGDRDKNAATDELLRILNNKISKEEASQILTKAIFISRISQNFNKERLRVHLSGYCLQHFTEKQVEEFYHYLSALSAAKSIHNRTPSEVRRIGDGDVW